MDIKQLKYKNTHLASENRRLKRENSYLRHRLGALTAKPKKKAPENRAVNEYIKNQRVGSSGGYFKYLLLTIKSTSFFRLYDRIFFTIRNYMLASSWIRIFLIAFAWIQTSAVLFLIFGTVIIVLPSFLIIAVIVGAAGALSYRKWDRIFTSELKGKKVYIMFAPGRRRPCGFFLSNAHTLSKTGAVIIVSRSPNACGFSGALKKQENLYYVFVSYYFELARKLGGMETEKIYKIY